MFLKDVFVINVKGIYTIKKWYCKSMFKFLLMPGHEVSEFSGADLTQLPSRIL